MLLTAAQTATPDAMSAAGAEPRRRKRSAASMISGNTRYSSRSWLEDEESDERDGAEQGSQLHPLRQLQWNLPRLRPKAQQEGRDQEHAHGVARPPHGPGLGEARDGHGAGYDQHEAADGRAYGHAGQGTKKDQGHRIDQPVELELEAGLLHEHGGGQRSKRVAEGYARRAERVWTDGKVDGQGGNGDGGPDARAEDKHRDQRDAGRRPHRRDLAMDERELQTELRRYEVGNPAGPFARVSTAAQAASIG